MATRDVIDTLAGIAPGSALDRIRAARPTARANAQASYDALFDTADLVEMQQAERFAVAAFVAGLHERPPEVQRFYASQVERHGGPALAGAVAAAVTAGRAQGPYGAYPPGPLSAEDQPGSPFVVPDAVRVVLDRRLAAAFDHVHMLVFHPRDASPQALQTLLDAGWSTTGIVTLSQVVAFLAFQIRVVDGLTALAGETGTAS